MRTAGILATTSIALAACVTSSTEMATTWKDPGVGKVHFDKVMTLFVSRDPAIRRQAEDDLAAKIQNATPAYQVVPEADLRDPAVVKQKVQEGGFDGAVVMRIVQVAQQSTYVPGTTWYTGPYDFWGYWGNSWGAAYTPGNVMTDQVVTVESAVYSVQGNRLIWAGRSETIDPKNLSKLIDGVTKSAVKEMKRQGLL
jgi:hypothetical protein